MQEINRKNKTCIQCDNKKPIKDFYYKVGGVCKDCFIKRSLNYYYRNRDRIIKQRAKKRKGQRERKLNSEIQNHVRIVFEQYTQVRSVDENVLPFEVRYCSIFGCGKKLKSHEILCGNKCIDHMIIKKELFHNGLL